MSHIIYEPVRQRLQRSELAVPGSNPKMFEKALKSSADYVFLDLEDAVAPDDKVPARKNVIEAINDLDWSGNGKTICPPTMVGAIGDANFGVVTIPSAKSLVDNGTGVGDLPI